MSEVDRRTGIGRVERRIEGGLVGFIPRRIHEIGVRNIVCQVNVQSKNRVEGRLCLNVNLETWSNGQNSIQSSEYSCSKAGAVMGNTLGRQDLGQVPRRSRFYQFQMFARYSQLDVILSPTRGGRTEIEEDAARFPAIIASKFDVKPNSDISGGVTVPTNTMPYESEPFPLAIMSTLIPGSGQLGQEMDWFTRLNVLSTSMKSGDVVELVKLNDVAVRI